MNPQKNYIDAKGNYHNVENLTLTQIHDRASEEGYRLGKAEAIAAADILPEVVEIIRDILPQVVEIAKNQKHGQKDVPSCEFCKFADRSMKQEPLPEPYKKDGGKEK